MREDICNVGMGYENHEELWAVGLSFKGVSEESIWYFEKPKDAKKLYDILQNYLVTRNQKPQ